MTEIELKKYMSRSLSSEDIIQEFRLRTRKNAMVILDLDSTQFNTLIWNYPAILEKFIIDKYQPISAHGILAISQERLRSTITGFQESIYPMESLYKSISD